MSLPWTIPGMVLHDFNIPWDEASKYHCLLGCCTLSTPSIKDQFLLLISHNLCPSSGTVHHSFFLEPLCSYHPQSITLSWISSSVTATLSQIPSVILSYFPNFVTFVMPHSLISDFCFIHIPSPGDFTSLMTLPSVLWRNKKSYLQSRPLPWTSGAYNQLPIQHHYLYANIHLYQ